MYLNPVILASLSESLREQTISPELELMVSGLIAFTGPFLILFQGGVDSLLGTAWLIADILIVRGVFIGMKRYLDGKRWWKHSQEYLWGCVLFPLPLLAWMALNWITITLWCHAR